MLRVFSIICVVLITLGCKQENTSTANTPEEKKPIKVEYDKRLSNPCNLISQETIAKYTPAKLGGITIKDASNGQNLFTRSCFFKWKDPHMPNAGILLQSSINPVAGEAPDYLVQYVESKKSQGEQDIDGTTIVYKDFDGHGDDGAGSFKLHKYIWRDSDQVMFTLAFNTALSEADEKKAAHAIASEVMQKFK